MLVGREVERARVDRLLAQARDGGSTVLLIRGEAGIGKTALCGYALKRAKGMTVLAVRGAESEAELSYAGLADLFRPVLDRLDAIPAPQAAALAGALAIAPPAPAEPFTVAAATLSLLAAAAEEAPVLALIDDAHWLDRASAQALGFAARRLGVEGVALLVAARSEHSLPLDLPDASELSLIGLEPGASKTLLSRTATAIVADSVAERLCAATAGNPLALIEACGMLNEGQLAGTEPLQEPPPAGPSLERAFLQHVSGLPADARRALLVAAASGDGTLIPIAAAIRQFDLDPILLELSERADLITVAHGTLEFRHPLLRSAVYHSASAGERRAAHAALAAALPRNGQSDRRAWHLAASALAPDEDIAAELERAALDARRRRGHAAAGSAFERAASLTPDDEQRARRLLEAATDLQLAGASDAALGALEQALSCTDDALLRAKTQHLRGRVELWLGRLSAAHDLLVSEAGLVEELDPSQAALMLAEAALPCYFAADIKRGLEIARRAHALGQLGGGQAEVVSSVILAEGLIICGESRAGAALLRRGCAVLEGSDPLAGVHELLGSIGSGLIFTEEYTLADRLLTGAVNDARAASAPAALPWLLACRSQLDYRTGRWRQAYAEASEAAELATETGQVGVLPFAVSSLGLIEAAEGREADCREHNALILQFAQSNGVATMLSSAGASLGLLELGLGRAAEAIDWLEQSSAFGQEQGVEEPALVQWAPDLIEAYVLTGRLDDAAVELATLERQAAQTEGTWALATAARCRGLLAEDDAFDECFADALRWHDRLTTPFDRARTQLCHGERLRRSGRRVEARAQLRSALAGFESLGAGPWATRARSELGASGERARRREPFAPERLTPREFQVGQVVAEGATNREAAAALFLTPKTIEFHLGHIYSKLGIRSRAELARLFAAGSSEQLQTAAVQPLATANQGRAPSDATALSPRV